MIHGALDPGAFGKLVNAGADVQVVSVDGRTAYWVSGAAHVFFYRDGAQFREQRLAGNTLVWQRGSDIVRVEGADLTLAEALEIAAGIEEP